MWRYGNEDVNYVPKEELISLMRAQTLPTSIAGITDFSENLLSTVWTGGLASPRAQLNEEKKWK